MFLSVYKGYYMASERVCSVRYCTNISAQKIDYVSNSSLGAWGKRRNPQTFEYENLTELMFDRGFTGHEHLELFDLINMNGRVYDPSLGRFLSPDNYVQAPDFSQSFNRYSYCWNNPLRYTDPDGEREHLVIGAVIGGTINWVTHGAEFTREGLGYFGIGVAAGALGAGVGAGVGVAVQGGSFGAGFIGTTTAVAGGGFLGGAAGGFTNGFISATGNSLLAGENFGNSLVSGLKSGGIQGLDRKSVV